MAINRVFDSQDRQKETQENEETVSSDLCERIYPLVIQNCEFTGKTLKPGITQSMIAGSI